MAGFTPDRVIFVYKNILNLT